MPNNSDESIEKPFAFEENDISQEFEGLDASDDLESSEEMISDLERQLKESQIQSENYLDQWRRTAAEFANYKKRIEREQIEATKYCNAALLTRLLPILNDIDRAFQHLPDVLKDDPWIEGMTLILRKLHNVFEQEGIQEIAVEGQKFDPNLHEAVTHEPNDSVPEGYILGEIEKGYCLNDRVLRPAKVRVSAG